MTEGSAWEAFEALRVQAEAAPEDEELQLRTADAALAAGVKEGAAHFLCRVYRRRRTAELYERIRSIETPEGFRLLRLPAPRPATPFFSEIPEACRTPFRRQGPMLLAAGGIFLGLARGTTIILGPFVEILYFVVAAILLGGLAVQVMTAASRGKEEWLDFGGEDLWSMSYLLRMGAFLGLGGSQLLMGAFIVGGSAAMGPTAAAIWAATVGLMALTPLMPAVLMIWGLSGGTDLERANPVRWIQLVRRTGRDYAATAGVFAACFVGMIACEAFARVLPVPVVYLVPPVSVLLYVVQIYLTLVAFRLLGRLWLRYDDALEAIGTRTVRVS